MEALKNLAMQYYEECETYNRTICTGEETKYGAAPATREELMMVLDNARSIFKQLSNEAAKLGFTSEQLRAEMGQYVNSGELELDRTMY